MPTPSVEHLSPEGTNTDGHRLMARLFDVPMHDLRDSRQTSTGAADHRTILVDAGCKADALEHLATQIDAWRNDARVDVVFNLLGPKEGQTGLFNDAAQRVWREVLLPRASVVVATQSIVQSLPRAAAVCVPADGGDVDAVWIQTTHANGWLTMPQGASGAQLCAHMAPALACAMARGFVVADAAVLATMAVAHPRLGFASKPALLPFLSWGAEPAPATGAASDASDPCMGLYVIVDSISRLHQVLRAGARTVQLRIKRSPDASHRWQAQFADTCRQGVELARQYGAELFINDHWEQALHCGASAVHLGQEDLLAMDAATRQTLLQSGLRLGVSTHSLWELCRARTLAPRYVACGPVWPTLTKEMPWKPQGLHNLRWWSDMAGVPVVAIGGILEPSQAEQAAACQVGGVCVVRGLGNSVTERVQAFQRALQAGMSAPRGPTVEWPMPSLEAA